MAAKFEIFIDRKKQHRFHLKASNGEIIAASGAYETKAMCLKGIKSIQKSAPIAKIIDLDEAARGVSVKRGAKAAPDAVKEKKPRGRKPKTE